MHCVKSKIAENETPEIEECLYKKKEWFKIAVSLTEQDNLRKFLLSNYIC